MRMKLLFLSSFSCVFILLSAQYGHAAIYKYLNKDGTISIVNDMQSIPEQYRSGAKVIVDGTDEEAHQSVQNQQAPEQHTGNHEHVQGITHTSGVDTQYENYFLNNHILLTAIVVISAVFVFIVLGILEPDHKKAVVITRVTIVWAVALYLLIVHAGDAVRVFRTVSGAIDDVKQQSAEKGKNAAKAVKAMDKLVEQVGRTSSTDLPEEAKKE
jgi:hypothetical protein